jgi:hypothetical protein
MVTACERLQVVKNIERAAGIEPAYQAWEHAWELFVPNLCINGVHPDHLHAWYFGLIVRKARYCSKCSNGLNGTRRPLWPLGSFAQLGAPDQVRPLREVSVGTYTLWRCMPVWHTRKTRSGIRRCGPATDPAGSRHIQAKAARTGRDRASSPQPGSRQAEPVF